MAKPFCSFPNRLPLLPTVRIVRPASCVGSRVADVTVLLDTVGFFLPAARLVALLAVRAALPKPPIRTGLFHQVVGLGFELRFRGRFSDLGALGERPFRVL